MCQLDGTDGHETNPSLGKHTFCPVLEQSFKNHIR
jgi:hypothetical protein